VTVRSTGILLVMAFVVFLVGAGFWLVREFERPLAEALPAVNKRRRRWIWIHCWMVAGTLVSLAAITSLVQLLRREGGELLSTAGLVAFGLGCLGFLVALVIRLTATTRAAGEAVRTGAVPVAYRPRHRVATALYVAHMLLSYATFALLGSAMLGSSLFPNWLGWIGIGGGAVAFAGFTLLRGGPFAPPILAHTYGLLVGIVLLLG
jgi:hypothetical protein